MGFSEANAAAGRGLVVSFVAEYFREKAHHLGFVVGRTESKLIKKLELLCLDRLTERSYYKSTYLAA